MNESDDVLIDAVADVLAAPGVLPATSFELHAALELLARRRLLSLVPEAHRDPIRARIRSIGAQYAQAAVPSPRTPAQFASVEDAEGALLAAAHRHDVESFDDALQFLLTRASLEQVLALLRSLLVDSLGAASHAPLVAVAIQAVPSLARIIAAPLRSLVAGPNAMSWHRAKASGGLDLWRALANPPRVASDSTRIAATMLAVERAGLPATRLGAVAEQSSTAEVQRVVTRLAGWSMLHEPDAHAPYGWTHALTLPLGVLELTRETPEAAAGRSIAATHLLAFRATLGTVALPDEEPPLPGEAVDAQWSELLVVAGAHPDAHVSKYALAALDAAHFDPRASGLYWRALEHLLEVWRRQ